jgi:hypothetical protein
VIVFTLFVLLEACVLGFVWYLGWTACEKILGKHVNEAVKRRMAEKVAELREKNGGGH